MNDDVLTMEDIARDLRGLEYTTVVVGSRRPDRLRQMHLQTCDVAEAGRLLGKLLEAYPLDRELDVKLGCRTGVARYKRDRDGRHTYQISLPDPDTGRLRVGLVLHEYAHLLVWAEAGKFVSGHGTRFVQWLDCLVEWRYGCYEV